MKRYLLATNTALLLSIFTLGYFLKNLKKIILSRSMGIKIVIHSLKFFEYYNINVTLAFLDNFTALLYTCIIYLIKKYLNRFCNLTILLVFLILYTSITEVYMKVTWLAYRRNKL